jgi:transcriptional regulator with XRE-family HTH domain
VTADAETIGARIRRWRTARGWTQRELAKEVGVHMNQVLAWEKGRHTPAVQRRTRLARALGVQPEVLFLVGEERSLAMEEAAANVMLTIARNDEASPAQQLSAARGLLPKAGKREGKEAAMAEFRRTMEEADADLTRILREVEAEDAG